jgi:hypothetical protein
MKGIDMTILKKLIKLVMRNKKRRYKVVYIATGYMSNKYDVATIEFYVSDKELYTQNFDSPMQYGFYKNYKMLSRHFPVKTGGAIHWYTGCYIHQ